MTHRAIRMGLVVVCLLGACECRDKQTPERSAQSTAASNLRKVMAALPKGHGEPIAPSRLTVALPDQAGPFRANAPPVVRNAPLANGGEMPAANRYYNRGDLNIRVEVTDVLHAPAAAAILQQQYKKAGKPTFEGRKIKGNPALLQVVEESQTVLLNVLVAKRFIINFRMTGSSEPQPVLELADALDYTKLAALLPEPDDADAGSDPPKEPTASAEASDDQAADDEEADDEESDDEATQNAPAAEP